MVRLFINKYSSPNEQRNAELAYCLGENKKLFNTIYLLDGRPTYQQIFDKINDVTGDNDINVIANSDIFFDKTIFDAAYLSPSECYALSRWDVLSLYPFNAKIYNEAGSQDVWIFKGKVKKLLFADFPLGVMGCDNRIAFELSNVYKVSNPATKIKCYHYHLSNYRTYDTHKRTKENVIPEPYLAIKIS